MEQFSTKCVSSVSIFTFYTLLKDTKKMYYTDFKCALGA